MTHKHILCILDIFRFLFIFPHRDHETVDRNWLVYSIIVRLLQFMSNVFFVVKRFKFSVYMMVFGSMCVFVGQVANALHISAFIFKRTSINKILKDVRTLQYSLVDSKFKLNICCVILVSLEILKNINFIITNQHDLIWVLNHFLTRLTLLAISGSFVLLLDFFGEHFKHLSSDLDTVQPILLMQIELHDHLLETCRELNEFYSNQLILLIFEIFFDNILDSYLLIIFIMNEISMLIPGIMFCVLSLLGNVTCIFMLARACCYTKKCADAFYDNLFNLAKNNEELCNNNIVQMYLKRRTSIEFTAGGFFTLNYSLICSVISTSVSYIIIVVQLEASNVL